jgi:hypothetical protein
MKLKHIAAIFLLSSIGLSSMHALAVDQPLNGPASTANSSTSNEALKEQYALSVKSQLRNAEETHQKNIALLNRNESMMNRQERDVERFEKILDTWERQQMQYQKYLDSLQKK